MAKKGKNKQTRTQAAKVLKDGPIRRRTAQRDVALPGLEDVRIRPLDDICVNIAEARAELNELKAQESGYQDAALELMREHRRKTWTHAGITLVRKPGEETLIVKNASARTRRSTAEQVAPIEDAPAETTDVVAMDADDAVQ